MQCIFKLQNKLWIWVVCLGLFVRDPLGNFHLFVDVAVTGEGLQILTYARHSLIHGSHLEQRIFATTNATKSKLHLSSHKSLCWLLLMQWLVYDWKIGTKYHGAREIFTNLYIAIEQWWFFSVPHQLPYGTSVYKSHLLLGVVLLLPVLTT